MMVYVMVTELFKGFFFKRKIFHLIFHLKVLLGKPHLIDQISMSCQQITQVVLKSIKKSMTLILPIIF